MDDELPPLPRNTSNLAAETFPIHPTKKRVRHSSFTALSSDPAIFSSDDDPSAENYLRVRRKKQFRGPWYQQVPASEDNSQETEGTKKVERRFERKYDSGVFMGSDGTDLDEVMEVMERKQTGAGLPVRQPRTSPRVSQLEKSREEIWVERQIQQCLEDGNESIDLSSQQLTKLSNATIRPLSTFATVPPVSQDVFHHLEPNLKIFLSLNRLQTLPEELFYLDRLTALSLRSNSLRDLPCAIGNLRNLRELNISLNLLEYLPYEILDLFSEDANLRSFTIHPNPFLQPELPIDETLGEVSEDQGILTPKKSHAKEKLFITPPPKRTWSPHWKPSFQARTDVRYFDKHGMLIKGPSFDRPMINTDHLFSIPTTDPTLAPEPPTAVGEFQSHAPSLLETALQSCLQTPQASQLSSLLPDDAPDHLREMLEQAAVQKESGFGNCTICDRKMIVKRTEWIEWWEIALVKEKGRALTLASAASPLRRMENERDVFESKVPLVRRGCSWFCVPRRMEAVEVGDGKLD